MADHRDEQRQAQGGGEDEAVALRADLFFAGFPLRVGRGSRVGVPCLVADGFDRLDQRRHVRDARDVPDVAESVAKLTLAEMTPGSFERFFSMRAAQLAQVMPDNERRA